MGKKESNDNFQQLNLFNFNKEFYKIKKPIRLIEFFTGIGAQHKALKQLTDQVESWKICEWAYNSYCSYNAIHIKDFTDYSQNLSKEELIERVRGTSTNYNEPLTDKQLKQKPIEWLRNAYNNIKATHNLINIMEVHGKDLEIVDTDKYEYIMTYSFPCQDLSLAGKRQGMGVSQKDGGTRSGLLWEVERILGEIAGGGLQLPQILVMENVPEVIGQGNVKHFNKWLLKLESLGYTNYFQILNSKHYAIPQNRKRCFMVSILGNYAYEFPLKLKLKYRVMDILEKKVDKKYYLTDEKIKKISLWKAQQKPLENMQKNISISPTLTARGAGEEHSGMVLIDTELFEEGEVVDFDSSDEFRREHSTEETPSLLTHPKLAVVEKDNDESDGGGSKLRIRKLTPKECIRLMGFTDEDYEAMRSIGMTDSAIYHMAGDSIVVTVLISIFSQLMFEDDRHKKVVREYIKKGIIEEKCYDTIEFEKRNSNAHY